MSAADLDVIIYRLDAMAKDIADIRAEQKAVASRGICPAPGSCVILQRDVEKLVTASETARAEVNDRIRSLEDLRAEGRGVAMAAKAFWAFVGAGGLGVIFTAWSVLKKA